MKTMKKVSNERKYVEIVYLTQDLYPGYMQDSFNATIKRQPDFVKDSQRFNRSFSKEDIQMSSKHVERC
jgi:hypothetical protein